MRQNFTWHDIHKRMVNDNCPICDLIEKRTDQKIEVLQYQHVTDVDFRKDFIDSGGFCSHHTERFYEKGDALNHAIVYAHLLSFELNRLEKGRIGKKRKTEACMFCESENTSETIYLNLFSGSYAEPAFKTRYEESGLLCMTHFKSVLRRMEKTKDSQAAHLKTVTTEKYGTLLHQLKEIKRKNDFRFHEERLDGKEKKAWSKARKLLIDQGQHRR